MSKARFLNKEKVIQELTKLSLQAKAKDKNIDKIILFGSLVNDMYTATSDADLLVILKKSDLPFIERIPKLLYFFVNAPIPVDIFPYTIEEIESIPFAKRAISEGIVISEKQSS